MNLGMIFMIMLIHWIADFVCQSHWEAVNKSVDNRALLSHVMTYSAIWYAFSMCMITPSNLWWFLLAPITFVCHYATDWVSSRMVRKLFAKGDYHNGFVVIGVDQMLHYAQLFITIKLLA